MDRRETIDAIELPNAAGVDAISFWLYNNPFSVPPTAINRLACLII